MSVYQSLLSASQNKRTGYFILIDPDKMERENIPSFVSMAAEAGVDAFLVGGSLVADDSFERCISTLKQHSKIPVIIFPGGVMQISKSADALLFLSLLSGRNPEYLIGNQVLAAPIVKKIGLETIATAYLLIESGTTTSVQFISNTQPIPRNKIDIAVAHALAAEILGFKMIYLEAGSGAEFPVPDEMISAVKKYSSLPLIVGGGITTPEIARKKVLAGANFIVTGNVLEKNSTGNLMKEFAEAVHHP